MHNHVISEMLKGAVLAIKVCALASQMSSVHANSAFVSGPAFPTLYSHLQISTQPRHRLSSQTRSFGVPSLRCSSSSDSKQRHGNFNDYVQQRVNECAVGMGLSTFLACLLVAAPFNAVAQQPESRAPAVTKSVGAPELPNAGGFQISDELSKFPGDLSKQLGSIKVVQHFIL
jgi:hypothetical protein